MRLAVPDVVAVFALIELTMLFVEAPIAELVLAVPLLTDTTI